MNNNEWITDRLPTRDDCVIGGTVWVWDRRKVYTADSDKEVLLSEYYNVKSGTPWQPIIAPEPYVKPKRHYVVGQRDNNWDVYRVTFVANHAVQALAASGIPTREAAERIAAIYEEVMP